MFVVVFTVGAIGMFSVLGFVVVVVFVVVLVVFCLFAADSVGCVVFLDALFVVVALVTGFCVACVFGAVVVFVVVVLVVFCLFAATHFFVVGHSLMASISAVADSVIFFTSASYSFVPTVNFLLSVSALISSSR